MKKIVIIGAGPVGCYAGYLLAKSGHDVSIYEEHPQIGMPIQCTGLLTADFDQFKLPLEHFVVNTFDQIEVFSPKNKLLLNQKEYLVCRNKFDNFLANLALTAGTKIFLNRSFVKRNGNKITVKDLIGGFEKELSPDLIIAADGPLSKVAKAFDQYHSRRKNYFGIQATVSGNFEAKKYQTFFGQETCPELFAWIVPESSTIARVGLATTVDTKKYFDRFIREQGFKALELQAGLIPLYHPKQKLYADNCYLLGDAAGFVKATTLGGIIPGMQQAQILVDCINNGKDYETEVGGLRKKLNLHLRIRKILNRFSDKDWEKLIALLDQDKLKAILEEHTRENPFPILVKSLIKEPKLLYFMKYLF